MPGPDHPNAMKGGLLPTPSDDLRCEPYQPSRKRSRSAAGAKIINITHNNYGLIAKPAMKSNFTQTPAMGAELTTQPFPDLLDLKLRLDAHLTRRDLTMKQAAKKISEFLTTDLTDPYDLEDLQGNIELVLDVVNVKGRTLEIMLDNNHTVAHVIWVNYLNHNKITTDKNKKITELEETKVLMQKLQIDHIEALTFKDMD